MDFLARAQTFLRVAESGSLSAAARSLRVSLAAVSRHVSSLERELGASLFERTTRRLRLTEAGRRFHDHAARLVHEADAARASVRPEAVFSGRLVLSTSVTLGTLRVLPALPELLEAHPKLQLEVRLEDRPVELVGEGVDVALRAGLALPDSASLVARPIASFRQVLVASPAYLRRASVPRTVEDLAGHVAIRGLGGSADWQFEREGERTYTVAPAVRLRVGTLLGVRAAAEAGVGVAVLPDFVAADPLARGALRELRVGGALPRVVVHALYRVEARGGAKIDAVVRHLSRTVPFQPVSERAGAKRGRS